MSYAAIGALRAANHLAGGIVPGLLGIPHPNAAPYGPIPTADGELLLGAIGDERRFADAGIACAPVNRIAEMFREDHVDTVGLVQDVGHPAGSVRLVASPPRIDGGRPPVRRAPPLHGGHTAPTLDGHDPGGE